MIYDRQITISAGASRRASNWQPQTLMLSELYTKLQVPARGAETLAKYMALPKSQQDELKDVGGFVGGRLTGPCRKANTVAGRDVLTLDLDHIPPGGTEDVLRRVEALSCGYCIYSTRKHSPAGPRLRILIPVDRTVTSDEYEPITRKTAAHIGLEMADPSTFQASRLMYWPSCCADSEYIYYFADKPMLSADSVLDMYENWRDVGAWPQVPGAQKAPTRLAARQGDPEKKKGVVGAFCRTYDVPAAMKAFLPGIYEPVDNAEDRYTYTAGSTTGGAIIYDDGRFLFSHHATDPCGGRLVNSFDLVRLHRFGDQDDEAAPGTPTNRMPSYAAMCELASQDSTVAGLLVDERWAKTNEAFGNAVSSEEDDGSWRRPPFMDTNSQGQPLKSMKNLRTFLENDPKLKNMLRLNLFSGKIDVTGTLPWRRPGANKTLNDDDAVQLRIYLEPFFGKTPKGDILDAVAAAASDQAYHPIRDYLSGLTWDGVPRLDTLFIDYLGAEDNEYIRAVTRKAFVAAVARVMVPGIKFDTMLTIIGGQGRFKSTILAIMGGLWFNDSLRTFGDKDAMETILGGWIIEVAEMQALSKTDINAVKAFLSKTCDYFRAAYARYAAEHQRQCVFFGTTNSKECLTDSTGGRRFWPVDIDRRLRTKDVFRDLKNERNQLWAEAVVRWRSGEALHLPKKLEETAVLVQEDHRARHSWEGLISDFLAQEVPKDWAKWEITQRMAFHNGGFKGNAELIQRSRVCAVEIWCEALGKPRGDMNQHNTREINGLLERMPGWAGAGVCRAGKPYGVQRCYDRKAVTE